MSDKAVPDRNILLTREQEEFLESVVRTGEYLDANEAIRDEIGRAHV